MHKIGNIVVKVIGVLGWIVGGGIFGWECVQFFATRVVGGVPTDIWGLLLFGQLFIVILILGKMLFELVDEDDRYEVEHG